MPRSIGEASQGDSLPCPAVAAASECPAQQMRCRHCGDVIGVYEPLILLASDGARTTSAAAEPQITAEPGDVFHRTCYAASQPASATERA